jgi:hypothetical protein
MFREPETTRQKALKTLAKARISAFLGRRAGKKR